MEGKLGKMKDIKLVVGLGNPGDKYENTFHNVGVLIARKLEALIEQGNNQFEEFVELDGFMNKSGLNLSNYLRNKKYDLSNCLIAHDDSDLVLGQYKLSFGKSSAGQRGVQNIIDQFDTKDFWRLRIGIRDPNEVERRKASEFVLKKITPSANKILDRVAHNIAEELLG